MAIPLDEIELPSESVVRFMPEQLDNLLRPIMVAGQVSLFHCEEKAPLTAMAHVVAAAGAQTGGKAGFLDSGGNFSPNLVRAYCHDRSDEVINRILVAKTLGLDELEYFAEEVVGIDGLSVVVLDSLTGVLNQTGAPGSKGRQRKLFATLELLRSMVNKLGVHLMMTDHSSRHWSTGELKPIGGNVLIHDVDSVIRLTTIDISKDALNITVERSPPGIPDAGVVVRLGPTGIRSIEDR